MVESDETKAESQRTLERLTQEYLRMTQERRENDRQIEELKQDIEDIINEVLVAPLHLIHLGSNVLLRWLSI